MADKNKDRFAQFPIEEATWSSDKENELKSLRVQNKRYEESMISMLTAKQGKEEENNKLKEKVGYFEREFLKKAKELDSVLTEKEKLSNIKSQHERENKELNRRLLERNKQYDKLLAEVNEEKKQKNRLNMEREKILNDFKKTSVDKTLKDETSRLQRELNTIIIENAGLREKIDRTRTSLSKIEGEIMVDDNPYITDLSSQKLLVKFNSLYDNSWTDAYEYIYTKDMDEKMTCEKLIAIFKSCWDFCCEVANMQLTDLHNILLSPEEKGSKDEFQKKVKNDFPVQNSKIIKETRILFAEQFIPTLCESYLQKQKDTGLVEDLHPYVDKCIEICWYSAISDPPLVYSFEAKQNMDDFRGYTRSGDEIDYVVWPSMYLHEYGPLLYKGVVQYKMADKLEDEPEFQ